ncbi:MULTISPECIES: sensor histidine kinase [unclassified Rhizobium]|uniref:sensor histidine kinase n=1 Tax=unclassified Rhizobium TaxID=2613769 RepID=UPI001FFE21F1|nr:MULTISPECIES: CHASE3 domain-containing protein [unclassified Rhizobium]
MKSTTTFIRSTLIMLGVGVAVLLGIVGFSLWLANLNSNVADETASLRRLRTSIVNVLTSVQDAETGQRGFLLTQDRSYLAPYDKALAELPAKTKALADNVSSRPEYAMRLPDLDMAIDAKMAELADTIALTKGDDLGAARSRMKSNDGRDLMDRVRSILNDYMSITDDRLRVLVAQQLSAANTLQWVTTGGAIAIVFVLGGALFVIFGHVSELSRTREEIMALNAGLEERVDERTHDVIRANQEIQKFAYIVTHDLRAPLVNIMGFLAEFDTSLKAVTAYVLSEGKPLSENDVRDARLAVKEDLPEAMGFIRSSTRKMDALINAILKISRDGRRKIQPERVALKATIDATIASVQHQIVASEGKIETTIKVGDIVTDKFSLDQILGNLLDNAVKYHMPGRPLSLAVTAYPFGKGRIRIDVKDNGRGIAEKDHERVFELFRRAGEQDQQGEGIGLAHVRSLVRNLGGDITVTSELGAGSTFMIDLPVDLTKIIRSIEL